jgi:hypothetical protein
MIENMIIFNSQEYHRENFIINASYDEAMQGRCISKKEKKREKEVD